MDTSKEYIKMCDCGEIQDESPDSSDSSGQLWYCRECKEIATEDDGYSYCKSRCEGNYVWLPRQYQLQEMIIDKFKDWHNDTLGMCLEFHFFINYEYKAKSMEQLWLAFIMKEKFNKTWDRKDWNDL